MIWDMGVWEAVSGSGALGHRGVSRGVSGSPWPSANASRSPVLRKGADSRPLDGGCQSKLARFSPVD